MKKLWVQFKTNNATRVSTDGCDIVDDFLEACKLKLSPRFDSVPIDLLSLSFTADGSSLRTGLPLSEIPLQLGYSVNEDLHPLFIRAVDASPQGLAGPLTSRSLSESKLKAPRRKRKIRWEKLNEILERNTNKSKKTDSIANSCVTWDDVGHVLQTTPYTQSSKAIPDIEFGILSQYLSFASKCFGPLLCLNESARLHLIAPIIICVCTLFDGEVGIEKDLSGVFLRTQSHFEFVLSRGRKRIYIVEAKTSNMRQGLVQTLLGCEVAAEIGHLDSVYGIVTNYDKWIFLRSLDEKIEMEECCMDINTTGPVEASLLKITGKIYAMLSDDV